MSKKTIAIVNGPNLCRVGTREPSIYGSTPLPDYLKQLREEYQSLEIEVTIFFSHSEGEIITHLYELSDEGVDAIILNAGAYTHTSIAIADCVRAITCPVVELHLSNVFAREEFRHHSYIAPHCLATLSGWGVEGYRMALQALMSME